MKTAVRIALGIVLGAVLAALPLLHYGLGGGHSHTRGDLHAHHAH
jgi:hypothetical protein